MELKICVDMISKYLYSQSEISIETKEIIDLIKEKSIYIFSSLEVLRNYEIVHSHNHTYITLSKEFKKNIFMKRHKLFLDKDFFWGRNEKKNIPRKMSTIREKQHVDIEFFIKSFQEKISS